MKHKVAGLEGMLLDAACALAEGHPIRRETGRYSGGWMEQWPHGGWHWIRHPSTSWADGGPIIERERIEPAWDDIKERWYAQLVHSALASGRQRSDGIGPTLLIAAMRAYVASKFGDEVELP